MPKNNHILDSRTAEARKQDSKLKVETTSSKTEIEKEFSDQFFIATRGRNNIRREKINSKLAEEYKEGYNQRLKDEGKTGERHQNLYL